MAEKLYIYGCGGHAKVVAATARLCGYEIAGFWEDSKERVGFGFFGSKIICAEDVPQGANVFIAFGNNKVRLQKGMLLKEKFHIPTIIHPSAQIADGVKIGCGTYVGAMVNLDPDVEVGEFCIVNNGVNISHESILKDGCHICGGGQIAGNCIIGSEVMFGIGSCIIEKCAVGDHTVIGAGSTVIRNIPENSVAVGTPVKVIKNNG